MCGHPWPAFYGVELAQGVIESIEDLIGQLQDPLQRMAGGNPLLIDTYENRRLLLPLTMHLSWAH